MIRARQLGWRYPQGPLLRFPDLDLPQGGLLLLQGASGAGKSTWLSLVAALRKPAEGELVVADQDLARLNGPQRDTWRGRNVGFLPQRLHLSSSLSVQDNLGLVFFAAGLPRQSALVQETLQALDIGDLAARHPFQLSGGQAQRAALARAVLLSPRVLLADEPTASLDSANAAFVAETLRAYARANAATVICVSHDRVVIDAADDLVTLQRP